jgi:hypothetical protein
MGVVNENKGKYETVRRKKVELMKAVRRRGRYM